MCSRISNAVSMQRLAKYPDPTIRARQQSISRRLENKQIISGTIPEAARCETLNLKKGCWMLGAGCWRAGRLWPHDPRLQKTDFVTELKLEVGGGVCRTLEEATSHSSPSGKKESGVHLHKGRIAIYPFFAFWNQRQMRESERE